MVRDVISNYSLTDCSCGVNHRFLGKLKIMTIQDYIKKHSLTIWRKYPDLKPDAATGGFISSWTAAVFIKPESGEFPEPRKFEIFSNPEKTCFVSINLSAGLFRIVHNDLIQIASPWERINVNYELQAIQ